MRARSPPPTPHHQNIARLLKTCAAFGIPGAGGGGLGLATEPPPGLGDTQRMLIGAVGVPKLLELVADDKAPKEARSEAALCVGAPAS